VVLKAATATDVRFGDGEQSASLARRREQKMNGES
jgi:hypothetical protein